jgi:uncharacterized repeat protein (TIGR03803 family)
MLRKTPLRKPSAMLVLLVFGVLLGAASAQTESVLYSFCAHTNCTDGAGPSAGVVFDQNGNQYGTTSGGGSCVYSGGCGVVFKVTPKGEETVLYSFCAQSGCTDGVQPSAGLVFDKKGNLYGTTRGGGTSNQGVVFKLTPEGKEIVLHSFCPKYPNCLDGDLPVAGLVFDQKGNLYGTTAGGGANGAGVVFELAPKGKEIVLYSFCRMTNCTDGEGPAAGLTFDQKGNLYGTTIRGGLHNVDCSNGSDTCGVVFKLTPKGEETVLYSFCGQTNCVDGSGPQAGLVFDQEGNLYGTALSGGVSNPQYCSGSNYTCGVVFKLTPEGKETVLHSFCAQNNCTDGFGPYARLIFDQKGKLYGTTYGGGAYGQGITFKLTP